MENAVKSQQDDPETNAIEERAVIDYALDDHVSPGRNSDGSNALLNSLNAYPSPVFNKRKLQLQHFTQESDLSDTECEKGSAKGLIPHRIYNDNEDL